MRNLIVIAAAVLCIAIALASEASKQPVSLSPSTPLIGQKMIGQKTLHSGNQDSDVHRASGEESLISQVCQGCRIAALDRSRQPWFLGRV